MADRMSEQTSASDFDVRIRELRSDEWTTWRDLKLRSLEEAPDAFCADLSTARARRDQRWADLAAAAIGDAGATMWCAEGPDGLIGIASSRIDSDGTLHIESMWVAPEGRSRGTGRQLVDAALRWGTDNGATTAELWVTAGNGHAEVLYENAGFSATDDRRLLRQGSALQIVRMTRDL
jgi:GNAT superfamily N-acetyltransferase